MVFFLKLVEEPILASPPSRNSLSPNRALDRKVAGNAEGDAPLDHLHLDVILPEMPPPSRAWSTQGVKAYRAGHRPAPAAVFNRIAIQSATCSS